MLKIVVITVSDRAFRSEYPDQSGPEIKKLIDNSEVEAEVFLILVPDEGPEIRKSITRNIGVDYILTTGGTGLSPVISHPRSAVKSAILKFREYRKCSDRSLTGKPVLRFCPGDSAG